LPLPTANQHVGVTRGKETIDVGWMTAGDEIMGGLCAPARRSLVVVVVVALLANTRAIIAAEGHVETLPSSSILAGVAAAATTSSSSRDLISSIKWIISGRNFAKRNLPPSSCGGHLRGDCQRRRAIRGRKRRRGEKGKRDEAATLAPLRIIWRRRSRDPAPRAFSRSPGSSFWGRAFVSAGPMWKTSTSAVAAAATAALSTADFADRCAREQEVRAIFRDERAPEASP